MFMTKLRSLVQENYYNISMDNNCFIEERKAEIQLLYEELGYLIGFFIKDTTIDENQIQEFEDVGNWKRRLIEAAQKAEDSVDMFVSSAIIKDVGNRKRRLIEAAKKAYSVDMFVSSSIIKRRKASLVLGLKHVMDDLKSIKEEIMTDYTEKANSFQNLLNPNIMYIKKFEATGTCASGTTRVSPSGTEHEEYIVGFEDDALSIIDRLTGYRKKLDIISIAGMGGLGKTTLATKIFHDSFVVYHFDVRGWVTVSQAYSTQDMLLQLLASIGKSINEEATKLKVAKLCEMLYQSLKGRRYLIIIDDIWSCKVWDDVGRCFPNDNNGSRVLVTTRLTEVASHASQGGFTHNLQHLTQDQSWELLCRKTFRGYECPESLTEPGKRIAKKCGGLPLALVVIAGILEKEEKRKDLWENIAERVGSYIINDPKGCLDTLALSYDHLPSHLKKCFLYVGGFPEDYKIQVRKLIKLWMAEGFIEEPHERSWEEE